MSDELPFLPFHPPAWWTEWTSGGAPAMVRDEPPPMTDADWWRRPEQLGPPPGWVE